MRYGFKVREEGTPLIFTSNKEFLYPRMQAIVEKQILIEGDYQRYSSIMTRLLNILEELEKLLSIKRIKHKYVLVNGEYLEINAHFISIALKTICRYSEPLDGESVSLLNYELEKIEEIFKI